MTENPFAPGRRAVMFPPVLTYPEWLHPEIFRIGPVAVRWYGLMYVAGFFIGRVLLRRRAARGLLPLDKDGIDDFLIALFVGMLIGARGFYMAVYHRPADGGPMRWIDYFAVWEGGLAFHGALLGMVAAVALFSWRRKVSATSLLDGMAAAAPPGLFLGRLGNFANAELYGRPTDGPLGMAFPIWDNAGQLIGYTEPRHPSQIYQAVAEGLLAWLVISLVAPRLRRSGVLFSIAVCWYATARFFVEFLREKDAQLNYLFGWMTMGQLLCLIMLLGGLAAWAWFSRHGMEIGATPALASRVPENGPDGHGPKEER